MSIKFLILFAAVVWLFLLIRRRMKNPPPRYTQPAGRTAGIVETIVLGAAAALILAVSATGRSTGGFMLILNELQPEYAIANVVMFLCAVAGAVVALVIVYSGRTKAGALVLSAVLITYGFLLNGGSYPGQWILPERMTQPVVKFTINLSDTNVRGAELWVNGVKLGKLPYTTTLDAFETDVPYWSEPPPDYETDNAEIPKYDPYGVFTRSLRRWIAFKLPERLPERTESHSLRMTPPRPSQHEGKVYYARVQYAGEWGLDGGNISSGASRGSVIYRSSSHFSVIFPERQKRLDALLDKARLANYEVTPDWFNAIETYNRDGWIALRKSMEREPPMSALLDAWATWRYGLKNVTDADSAWQAFERICEEADADREYFTSSVVGRAVELLAPKLPQERLVDKAVTLIRTTGSYGYFNWRMNNRLQFGYSENEGGVGLGAYQVSGNSGGGKIGAPKFPMSGFPVVHALWMLNERLAKEQSSEPNLVQRRLVPEIVRWHSTSGMPVTMLIAAYLGGPAIDQFLLRQDWRVDPEHTKWDDRLHLGIRREANKWLYLLAYLNDKAGRDFRHAHTDAVMDMADKFYEQGFVRWRAEMDFVFADPWLAREYWPRFARLARQRSPEYALETQWRYLLQMGDAATPDMFIDAWRDTIITSGDFFNADDLLFQIKPPFRELVVNGIVELVQKTDANIGDVLKSMGSTDRLISELQARGSGTRELTQARHLLETLQKGPQEEGRIWQNVPLWLAHTESDSPLVEMLAKSDDPALRLMTIGALREHPTPPHMAFLRQFLKDPDPTGQRAAEDAFSQLQTLAAQNPAEYASDAD